MLVKWMLHMYSKHIHFDIGLGVKLFIMSCTPNFGYEKMDYGDNVYNLEKLEVGCVTTH